MTSNGGLSIHDLLAEVDFENFRIPEISFVFQFTTSSRRSTRTARNVSGTADLSIHDLLAEVDCVSTYCIYIFCLSIHDLLAEVDTLRNALCPVDVPFNSRPPRGGRPSTPQPHCIPAIFQFTTSSRRSTMACCSSSVSSIFQFTTSSRRSTVFRRRNLRL